MFVVSVPLRYISSSCFVEICKRVSAIVQRRKEILKNYWSLIYIDHDRTRTHLQA
jgi:hypothetical protein